MKQLTWLAAERRLCTDGDSEEEHSPTSTGSQEEEEEEEEEGPKGEESGEGRSSKESRDEETPTGERTPRGGGGRCPGRGRGQNRFVCPLQTPPGTGLTVWLSQQGGADLYVACGGVGRSATAKTPPSCCSCTMKTSWTTTRTARAKTWRSPRVTSTG